MIDISESTFWKWSLLTYQCKSLQKHLLELQDEAEMVVMEILLAAWLAKQGLVWSEHELAKLRNETETWVREVCAPLRLVRRNWTIYPERRLCRDHLKKLELQSERHLSQIMIKTIRSFPQPLFRVKQAHTWCLRHNLQLLLLDNGDKSESELERLVELLMEYK